MATEVKDVHIAIPGGTRSVRGELFGAYIAVTPGDCSEPQRWTVTHRPTGYAICANLALDDARLCARQAELEGSQLWDFATPDLIPKDIQALGRRLRTKFGHRG